MINPFFKNQGKKPLAEVDAEYFVELHKGK